MKDKLETIEDVKEFITSITDILGLNFHPDNDFSDYTNDDGKVFTEEEVKYYNALLNQAFDICDGINVDLYKLTLDIVLN